MKKMLALFACALLLCMTIAHAEDLGVQVIGGQNAAPEVLTLDDMQLGERYEIDGYARVLPMSFAYQDFFAQYSKGKPGSNTTNTVSAGDISSSAVYYWYDGSGYYDDKCNYTNMAWCDSGKNADYAWLHVDLVNRSLSEKEFTAEITVKVVYDDLYEFGGWVRQYDENHASRVLRYNWNTAHPAERAFLHPEDKLAVAPMYTGHYILGCTLPNEVINGTEPLRMEIKLGDNELTYHIRK